MRTYKTLPAKYADIPQGTIKVIDGYAYAVKRAAYSGQRDYVFRTEESHYNQLRTEAQSWDVVKCEPTESNLQSEIWCYLTNEAGLTPYIQTVPYC